MARNVKDPSGYHSAGRTLQEKATNFGTFVKQFGWKGNFETDADGNVDLTAKRGDNEVITITWYKGGGGEVWYTLAGQRIKCNNVSAAAKIAKDDPDPSRFRRAVRKRKTDSAVEEFTPEMLEDLQGSLPFDHESSDAEIQEVLLGRTLTWINLTTGKVETAEVSDKPKHFSVCRNGHDYVNFVYPIPARVLSRWGKDHMESDTYGFRSVYLDRIVSVG
jgi:hypothetical protein